MQRIFVYEGHEMILLLSHFCVEFEGRRGLELNFWHDWQMEYLERVLICACMYVFCVTMGLRGCMEETVPQKWK